MQAVVLAAGVGSRMGEKTQQCPKCMVCVNGVPLIQRMLSQLDLLGLSRIIIVTGYKRECLKRFVATLSVATPIVFVDNSSYHKTNNIYSVKIVQKYLEEEDTLLCESDLIVEQKVFDRLMQDSAPNAALVAKYKLWMDGTVVTLGKEQQIECFIPKSSFRYSETDSYYKTVNVYKFSKEFSQLYFACLKLYIKMQGYQEYYEQVFQVLKAVGHCEIKAVVLDKEKWYEIDDIQDLDIAENIFSEGETRLKKYLKRYGGYWRFPELLDFCYLLNPYFPPKELLDEMQSNFSTLLANRPSGAVVNNLLAGKYFGISPELICVGNGASELISPLVRHLSGKMGVPFPTFEEYPNRYHADDIVPFLPSSPGFSYTEEDLIHFFTGKNISTLVMVNPDNPSGNFIPVAGLKKLIGWCKKEHIRLIIDESFVDFSDATSSSLLNNDLLLENPHLIIVKSISKSYGVPGLRLGIVATSDKEMLSTLRKSVSIWNINSFAEFYMQIIGKYKKQYFFACRKFREERARFYNNLQKIPFLKVYPTQSAYFLAEVTGKYTSADLTVLLLNKYNILMKDCCAKRGFDNRSYIRIGIRNTEDNDRLIQCLLELC